ncbi:Pectate lyase superfamily protein [compost metagenome]
MSTLRTDTLQTTDSSYTININSIANRIDLANNTDPTKGAALVGFDGTNLKVQLKDRIHRVVESVAELKALDSTEYTKAYINGYYASGDGGDGEYYVDAADLVSPDNGGSVHVAADGARWKLSHRGQVNVKQFGAKGDGVTDDTARLQAARDWLAAQSDLPELVFTPGIYVYSVSPNWAIQDARITAQGEVKLRYTGVGNAVIFDADAVDAVGPLPGVIYNVQFGGSNRFIVEAPGTSLNAFFVRSVHHAKIRGVVRGCGTASAGLKVNFAVLTEFDIIVSGNHMGVWYLGAKPAEGYNLDQRGPGETASYCYFPNAIVEGPDIGVHLVNSLGNIFSGGAFEGCTTYGALIETTALSDKFIGTDFEVNTVADVFCQGFGTEFIDCDTFSLINLGTASRRCLITGGQHQSIGLDVGGLANRVLHTTYNRFASSGTFTDGSLSATISDVRNGNGAPALSGSVTYDAPSIGIGATATTTITVQGARLGDAVVISSTVFLSGLVLNAIVSSANTVTVFLTNIAGVAVDAPSTTLRAWIYRQAF